MAQNVQMPRFGAASGQNAKASDWGEIDNFDVDMLAEYLLDDGDVNPTGVTFDFNIDSAQAGSTVVSPENSEDGNLPPVGEMVTQSVTYGQVQTPAGQPAFSNRILPGSQPVAAPIRVLAQPLGGVPLAPAPTNAALIAATQIPNMALAAVPAPPVIYQQLPPGVSGNVPKRRRLDAPAIVAAGAQPPVLPATMNQMMQGQQLAAAAAQALDGRSRSKKSQAQIDRRRERNRILARRTRLRKKFFFESLQKEVMDLQKENLMLKEMVKLNIDGDEGKKILDSCDAQEKLPPSVVEACGEGGLDMDSQDFSLVRSIQKSQHSFVITDPSLTDNPIVFASDDFLKITGYSRDQVLGRNCRFLQGTDTSKESIELIRKNLSVGEDASVCLINYKADGTPFWNKLFIAALRDAQNNIVNFIGVTVRVASPEPGHPEHGKVLGSTSETDEMDEKIKAEDDAALTSMEESVTAAVAAAATAP